MSSYIENTSNSTTSVPALGIGNIGGIISRGGKFQQNNVYILQNK